MDPFFKYPLTIPADKQNEVIINLLAENLATNNALMVAVSMLNAQISGKEQDQFVSVLFQQRTEMLLKLIGDLERKYGQ